MPANKIMESALVASVRHAFKTVLNLELETETVASEQPGETEMVCAVGMAGRLEGNVSVSLSSRCACMIVSRMVQESVDEVTADVCDGMCELANMIAGGVKVRVAERGYAFDISLPTVVLGRCMSLRVRANVEKIRKRFKAGDVVFDVEFVFKINQEGSAVETAAEKTVSKIRAMERLHSLAGKASRK